MFQRRVASMSSRYCFLQFALESLRTSQFCLSLYSLCRPQGSRDKPLKALLVDSWYDNYVGVVALIRLFDGTLSKGQQVISAHTGRKYEVSEVGVMHPHQVPIGQLYAGQVGYMVCGMKKSNEAHIGDTFYLNGKEVDPLPGFEELKPMVSAQVPSLLIQVFVGAFPLDNDAFNKMADSIEKLALNDRSLSIQRESSVALGQGIFFFPTLLISGFRMGFLGYLHVGITVDRLRQEYGSEVFHILSMILHNNRLLSPLLLFHIKSYTETALLKLSRTLLNFPILISKVQRGLNYLSLWSMQR
jgi:translation elongation factor EF-4